MNVAMNYLLILTNIFWILSFGKTQGEDAIPKDNINSFLSTHFQASRNCSCRTHRRGLSLVNKNKVASLLFLKRVWKNTLRIFSATSVAAALYGTQLLSGIRKPSHPVVLFLEEDNKQWQLWNLMELRPKNTVFLYCSCNSLNEKEPACTSVWCLLPGVNWTVISYFCFVCKSSHYCSSHSIFLILFKP